MVLVGLIKVICLYSNETTSYGGIIIIIYLIFKFLLQFKKIFVREMLHSMYNKYYLKAIQTYKFSLTRQVTNTLFLLVRFSVQLQKTCKVTTIALISILNLEENSCVSFFSIKIKFQTLYKLCVHEFTGFMSYWVYSLRFNPN